MPETSLADLPPNARDLAVRSLEWSEARWDEKRALLAYPRGHRDNAPAGPVLSVRNSVWLAVGFLLRNRPGDTEKACRTIAAILDAQMDEPGMPYHGTWYRTIGEPHPPFKDAVMWKDYDPNWRQFIGLGLAVILEEYERRLPKDLVARIERALTLAVDGEPPDRCPPTYSNIALMKAALGVFVGHRLRRPDTVAYAETFGAEVHRLFAQNNAFAEYNSPTYYGVNLYALGFWRRYMPSDSLRPLGAYMEAELWRDIARYYHAGLRNICGPYTRSYGMDMTRYTALTSLPIWLAFGPGLTPFPEGDRINSEFCYGPCMAILGVDAPPDVHAAFRAFEGPRQIQKPVTTEPKRVATAWLAESWMCGAESTGTFSRRDLQFHPGTAHWRHPDGGVGWLRLACSIPVDARADRGGLTLCASVPAGAPPPTSSVRPPATLPSDFDFHICAVGAAASSFASARWSLPGMTVTVDTNLTAFSVEKLDDPREQAYRVRYSAGRVPFEASIALSLSPG